MQQYNNDVGMQYRMLMHHFVCQTVERAIRVCVCACVMVKKEVYVNPFTHSLYRPPW